MSHRLLSSFARILAGVTGLAVLSVSLKAQVITTWTQKSIAGSTTNGESSAAVAMDTNYMFAVDNEHQILRLSSVYPSSCVGSGLFF